jgi:hypothetical protein
MIANALDVDGLQARLRWAIERQDWDRASAIADSILDALGYPTAFAR